MELNKLLIEKVDEYFPKCKELSDYITDNPELGCEEVLAMQAYKELLEAEGYIVKTDYKGVANAFHAVRKCDVDSGKPKCALMCEYDALPDIGHGCGHSISGAASLLAALAVSNICADLPLAVEIIGTPGEEYPGGKELLMQQKAFDGYEFAIMTHMDSLNKVGVNILACNDRYITFYGKSAHASTEPQDGINALNAARLYMDAMDMWRQHLPDRAQFHGIICNGGSAPSTVPDKIELNYYFRAINMAELEKICEISENCCRAAALATGCTYTAEQIYLAYADLSNVQSGLDLLGEIFDAMGESYTFLAEPQGSSDVGNVDYAIPVFHPYVDVTGGVMVPWHTEEFEACMKCDSGYKGLRNSAILMSSFVFELANNADRLKKIQEEHRIHRGLK